MFFPEELITYAVYSNPADLCQGEKTPERWLRLVLFGKEAAGLSEVGAKRGRPGLGGLASPPVLSLGPEVDDRGARLMPWACE